MKTKEIEKILIDKLLENKNQFFPLSKNIKIDLDREQPDCCLYLDNLTIGIEITCSMDENLQKTKKIRNEIDSSLSFSPSLFENKKMSSNEIKEKLIKSKTKLIGSAYKGNELEENTFNNIKNSIDKKIKKFETYQKLDQNWLYIYHIDRVTLNKDIVIELILNYINFIELKFDVLIIKLGKHFFKFNNKNTYIL